MEEQFNEQYWFDYLNKHFTQNDNLFSYVIPLDNKRDAVKLANFLRGKNYKCTVFPYPGLDLTSVEVRKIIK